MVLSCPVQRSLATGPGTVFVCRSVEHTCLGGFRFTRNFAAERKLYLMTPGIRERIVIVGAGFAGLRLARSLNNTPYDVYLIDRHNYHEFQPLMYQVATARLEPSSISFPLRKIFQFTKNVSIRIAEVGPVDTVRKVLQTSVGEIPYDHLVMALGCTTNYFNNASIRKYSFPMKSVPNAMALRNRILQTFEDTIEAGPAGAAGAAQFLNGELWAEGLQESSWPAPWRK